MHIIEHPASLCHECFECVVLRQCFCVDDPKVVQSGNPLYKRLDRPLIRCPLLSKLLIVPCDVIFRVDCGTRVANLEE